MNELFIGVNALSGFMSPRIHKSEPAICRTCGGDFMARIRSSPNPQLTRMCSKTCSHIYAANSRNTRVNGKGRGGGFRLKILYFAGKILSEDPGRPMSALSITSRVIDIIDSPLARERPSSWNLTRAFALLGNDNFVRTDNGHTALWSVKEPVNCLKDMLQEQKYNQLLANYKGDSE
jgi:hypothetical protein